MIINLATLSFKY